MWAPGVVITRGSDWWADKVETVDARGGPHARSTTRSRSRSKADVVVLAVGDSEQSVARGVGAQPPRRSHQPGSAGPPGRPGARGAGAGQADGRRADQRPPAVDQRASRSRRARSWRASTWARRAAPRVAAVLFGDVNPGGKLPVSFARSAGHLPVFYNHKPSARRGYLFDDVTPLFPFGHGLSYTTFGYKNLKVTPAPTASEDKDVQTVTRRRHQRRPARRRRGRAALPARRGQLRHPPGEGAEGVPARGAQAGRDQDRVASRWGATRSASGRRAREFVVEPGKFDVTVGGSSAGGVDRVVRGEGRGDEAAKGGDSQTLACERPSCPLAPRSGERVRERGLR